jgi:hypothetical protein
MRRSHLAVVAEEKGAAFAAFTPPALAQAVDEAPQPLAVTGDGLDERRERRVTTNRLGNPSLWKTQAK